MSFPRARGDVPSEFCRVFEGIPFSPRTRGCSCRWDDLQQAQAVFPAHAGMFLQIPHHRPAAHCFPRARGDVPSSAREKNPLSQFSPRTRGCSSLCTTQAPIRTVFPAHAGMFPARRLLGRLTRWFSPRTRGCSYTVSTILADQVVFPAHAGMFPPQKNAPRPPRSFPRARGDVPAHAYMGMESSQFSPRTRGCSEFLFGWIIGSRVFPAHAGMFPAFQTAPLRC